MNVQTLLHILAIMISIFISHHHRHHHNLILIKQFSLLRQHSETFYSYYWLLILFFYLVITCAHIPLTSSQAKTLLTTSHWKVCKIPRDHYLCCLHNHKGQKHKDNILSDRQTGSKTDGQTVGRFQLFNFRLFFTANFAPS